MSNNQKDADMISLMEQPFSKSITIAEKCKRLLEVVNQEDTLAILIDADPDSISSALALKRFYWRKARKITIYHINKIQRADNLAFIKLLKIDLKHIRHLKAKEISKWALLDSQPHHHSQFEKQQFDIIIDHHPLGGQLKASFVDIKPNYGANATILTEYLRSVKIKPSPELATALFYGIKTDTNNFVRESLPNDINAFRYLYTLINMNIIKKIESSEITKKTLVNYRMAMEHPVFYKDAVLIDMGQVDNPDTLVIIADFFMRLAEVSLSIISGIYDKKLIIIFRSAAFKEDAGKIAEDLFLHLGGFAGGHRSAARAEIPLEKINQKDRGKLGAFVLKTFKIYCKNNRRV